MPIERIPVTDRAAWLALRQRDVTASTVGCLLGLHEYQTAYGLWALKTGRIAEDPEETPPMRRGRLLEPVALQLLAEERPDWRIEPPAVYLRDPDVRLGATPDAFASDPTRAGFGVVQIKTVEPSVFRRKWRDPDTGDITPPLWIVVQAITEAHLAGASWAAVGAMTVSFGLELHVIEVPIHAGVIDRTRQAVADFWAMVGRGDEPDPDFARDGGVIARLYEADHGTEIDLSAANHLPVLANERDRLKVRITAAESRIEEIATEFKAALGNHATAILADGRRVSWRTQHRRAYSVAPASFRVLRFSSAPTTL